MNNMQKSSLPSGGGLHRRRFLRGIGACVAIPVFGSLARGASPAPSAPLRMAFMSIPNGVRLDQWFPSGTETDFELSSTMQPLLPVRDQLQIISGLKHDNATPGDDGAGDHARANATYLTGARARKTPGKNIHVGVSVDQLAAQQFGHLTRFPSLELSCDAIRNSGSCDSGYACAYQYNLSWSSATTPVSPEPNPRLVFERLFGAGGNGERRRNYELRQHSERSILDFVLDQATAVQRQLGTQDRGKLDEYLTSVRSIEKRIKSAEQFGAIPDPDSETPKGIPGNFGQHMDLMYDLLALSFQTDSTRVGSLLLANDGSNRSFPDIDITEGHHYLSHNQRKPEIAKKIAAIDHYYMERFASFINKLSNTVDVDGNSILHNSMIVYGGAIADGNRHTHHNLPVVLAGAAGGRFRTGRFLQVENVPMSNLFVSMLRQFGVNADSFGDSDGHMDHVLT